MTVAKMGLTSVVRAGLRVQPGRDWFIVFGLAERTIVVRVGETAGFSTVVARTVGAFGGRAEILCMLEHHGARTRLGLTG